MLFPPNNILSVSYWKYYWLLCFEPSLNVVIKRYFCFYYKTYSCHLMPQFITRTFHKFQLHLGGMQRSKFALQDALNVLWIEKWYQTPNIFQNAKSRLKSHPLSLTDFPVWGKLEFQYTTDKVLHYKSSSHNYSLSHPLIPSSHLWSVSRKTWNHSHSSFFSRWCDWNQKTHFTEHPWRRIEDTFSSYIPR